MKVPASRHFSHMLVHILAAASICAGISIFYTPNNLLSGGVWGVAMILDYFTGVVPLGVYVFLLNVPLVIWAWKELDKRFVFYTVWVIIIESVFLSVFPSFMPGYTENPLLACLFGGVMIGVGSGFIIKFYGSGGGLDVVGLILKKRVNISVGNITLFFNIFIVGIAALLFGFERAMYTMVSMYVSASVFDKVLEGFNPKRSVTIITTRGYDIARAVSEAIGRGGTLIKAEGAYTHTAKDVLICVISRYEVPRVKEIVAAVDPYAFVNISESNEVMGQFNDVSLLRQLFGRKKG